MDDGTETTNGGPETNASNEAAGASGRVRWARRFFAIFAWILVTCIAIQVFFAGLAIFVNPANWARHMSFANFFHLLPLLMLVLAFIGRLPNQLRRLSVLLFVLITLQYVLADLAGRVVAAFHPVNALLIFWLGISVARQGMYKVTGRRVTPA